MSNRDPLYGRTAASGVDPFEESPHPGATDDTKDTAKDVANQAKDKGQQAADTVKQKAGQAGEKASEAADKAHQQADKGMDQAASGLDQAADTLRQRGNQQGGSMGSMASSAANTLDQASGYLRDKDSDQLMDDIEAYIRQNPTQSLLIAAGVGFVLSKVFK